MIKTKSLLILIFSLLFSNYYLSFSQELTITTYYPSPVGIYKELRAKRMAIGDSFYDPSHYCWEGSCTVSVDSDADLIVEGKVGIKTENPQEELHVAGDTEIEGELKVEGDLKVKDHTGTIDSLLSGGIIKEKFLPYCKQEITSDVYTNGENPQTGCDFGGYTGYYDISNLTPENVKKGVTFGRGEVGTYECEDIIFVYAACHQDQCGSTKYKEPLTSCTAKATCPSGYKVVKCYRKTVASSACHGKLPDYCGGPNNAILRTVSSHEGAYEEFSPTSTNYCEYTHSFTDSTYSIKWCKSCKYGCGKSYLGETIAICRKE